MYKRAQWSVESLICDARRTTLSGLEDLLEIVSLEITMKSVGTGTHSNSVMEVPQPFV